MITRVLLGGLMCLSLVGAIGAEPLPQFSYEVNKTFQWKGHSYRIDLAIPEFPQDPEALEGLVQRAIQSTKASVDRIAGLLSAGTPLTWENTMQAYEQALLELSHAAGMASLLENVSTIPALRKKAEEIGVKVGQFATELQMRKDVYAVMKAYSDSHPSLDPEQGLVLKDFLREGKKYGLHLEGAKYERALELFKKLIRIGMEFDRNIREEDRVLLFSRRELKGMPDSFFNKKRRVLRKGRVKYEVHVNDVNDHTQILDFCENPLTRRKVYDAVNTLLPENLDLLAEALNIRQELAKILGYESWAERALDGTMAKELGAVFTYYKNLKAQIDDKAKEEVAERLKLKAEEMKVPAEGLVLEPWDRRYYDQKLRLKRDRVDHQKIREYFVYEKVLEGLIKTFENVLGLTIEEVAPQGAWDPSVRLLSVRDANTSEPLGLLYLDPYPRDGKYKRFAHFGFWDAHLEKQAETDIWHRPIAALVCNFPKPEAGQPSLLTYHDVETLFHEFGHAFHNLLSRARYISHAGTSVARDFVEVPSQLLEAWTLNLDVLKTFALHHQTSEALPDALLATLKRSVASDKALFTLRQMALAHTDLSFHASTTEPWTRDRVVEVFRGVFQNFGFQVPIYTHMPSTFGHLFGYDAQYWTYSWADFIQYDMRAVFETAPNGFLDAQTGARFRQEILEPGGGVHASELVRNFLGRDATADAYARHISGCAGKLAHVGEGS